MNKTYFKFEKHGKTWVLPVWKDSYMFNHPEEAFSWDEDIHFVSEVSEQEYDIQFIPEKKNVQLELDLF